MDILLLKVQILNKFEVHPPHHVVVLWHHALPQMLGPYASLHSPNIAVWTHESGHLHPDAINTGFEYSGCSE